MILVCILLCKFTRYDLTGYISLVIKLNILNHMIILDSAYYSYILIMIFYMAFIAFFFFFSFLKGPLVLVGKCYTKNGR